MPVDDLADFDLASDATITGGSKAVTYASWALAVDGLWSVPTPRFIQFDNGVLSVVTGGKVATTSGGRRFVLRYRPDATTDATAWSAASPSPGGGATVTVAILGAQAGLLASGGDRWYLSSNGARVVAGAPEAHRWSLTATTPATVDVPLRYGATVRGAETLSVTPAGWDVVRLNGDTEIELGTAPSGQNVHAYGWMLQNRASKALLCTRLEPGVWNHDFTSRGCWNDATDLSAPRAMPTVIPIPPEATNVVHVCAQEAFRRQKRLFSVQAGRECRLVDDDTDASAQRYNRASDPKRCRETDAENHNTGGDRTMALYFRGDRFESAATSLLSKLAPPPETVGGNPVLGTQGTLTHHGCWFNDPATQGTFIPASMGGNPGRFGTVLECARAAAVRNKRVFGVQNGGDCWLQDSVSQCKVNGPSFVCTTKDAANLAMGGSGGAFSLYEMDDQRRRELGGPKGYVLEDGKTQVDHHGCWNDNAARAPWNGSNRVATVGSVLECANAAAKMGRRVFGVENNNECFVGKTVDQAKTLGPADARCNPFRRGNPSVFDLYEITSALPQVFRHVHVRRDDGRDEAINLVRIVPFCEGKGVALSGGRVEPPSDAQYGIWNVLSGDDSFAQTNFSRNARITVDVQNAPQPIDHVWIVNRQDCCSDRIVGCVLELLDNDLTVTHSVRFTEAKAEYVFKVVPGGGTFTATTNFNPRSNVSQAELDRLGNVSDVRLDDTRAIQGHGCWTDDGNKTPFGGRQRGFVGTVQNVSQCARGAALRGKRAFGIEAGQECYVADSMGHARALGPATTCRVGLGGGNSFDLYRLSQGDVDQLGGVENATLDDGTVIKHHRCWRDNSDRQPFSDRNPRSVTSITGCARLAAENKKRVFGIEAGSQCFFADSVEQAKVLGPATDANPQLTCNDANKMGGGWAFNLYEMSQADVDRLGTRDYRLDDLQMTVRSHGCFRDDASRAPFAPRQGMQGYVSGPSQCARHAASMGKVAFGVENGGECWLAENVDQAKRLGGATTCRNDRGGPGAFDLYELTLEQMNTIANLPMSFRHIRIRRDDNRDEFINIARIVAFKDGRVVPLYPGRLQPAYNDTLHSIFNVLDSDNTTCAHTNHATNAAITVDVQNAPQAIDHVWIVNRQDCCQDRIVGCVMELLNNDLTVSHTYRFTAPAQSDYVLRIATGGLVLSPTFDPRSLSAADLDRQTGATVTLDDGVTNVKHHRCWRDESGRPPFGGRAQTRAVDNVSQCARAAAVSNKRVFGIEAGNQCFLADSVDQAKVLGPALDPAQTCDTTTGRGGAWAFNLYEMSQADVDRLTGPESVTLADGTVIKHHGCWRDNSERRPFGGRGPVATVDNVTQCAQTAALNNKQVFALEAGNQCFVADSVAQAKTLGPALGTDPGLLCNEANRQGGGWAFNLYEMSQADGNSLSANARNSVSAIAQSIAYLSNRR